MNTTVDGIQQHIFMNITISKWVTILLYLFFFWMEGDTLDVYGLINKTIDDILSTTLRTKQNTWTQITAKDIIKMNSDNCPPE